MIRAILWSVLFTALTASSAMAVKPEILAVLEKDAKGAFDSAYTGRYEGSNIVDQTTKSFDEIALPSGPASKKNFSSVVPLKGQVTRILYSAPLGRSSLEVFGNYLDALKAKGFEVVFECANQTCGAEFKNLKYSSNNPQTVVISEASDNRRNTLSRAMFNGVIDPRYALVKKGQAGAETYVALFAALNQGNRMGDFSAALKDRVGTLIEIVEPKAREDKIVTLSADDLGAAINDAGRVAIYGIFFDFDKADVKSESQPQLDQMVAYLQKNPALKVYIVGHTDNHGALDYNMKLSGARAIAVGKALEAAGVDRSRMVPKAAGPIAPLTSNRTPEGQAKNRRVELVELFSGQ